MDRVAPVTVRREPATEEASDGTEEQGVDERWRLERISVLFFTQLLPSSTYPIRSQLRQLVAQALVD